MPIPQQSSFLGDLGIGEWQFVIPWGLAKLKAIPQVPWGISESILHYFKASLKVLFIQKLLQHVHDEYVEYV